MITRSHFKYQGDSDYVGQYNDFYLRAEKMDTNFWWGSISHPENEENRHDVYGKTLKEIIFKLNQHIP